ICWPEPPYLDEDLESCDLLAEALYPEIEGEEDDQDAQTIELLGMQVEVWRGVRAYSLSGAARPIARRQDGQTCGYLRSHGRGAALLLGTWLAADAVAERGASILEVEPIPAGGAQEPARALAARRFGPGAAGALGPVPRPDTGMPRYLVVYFYPEQRRAGEFIAGGTLAYWDGQNMVGSLRVNTDPNLPPVEVPPYHPILPEHLSAARALHGSALQAEASDPRVQVRVLDGRPKGASTIAVTNRYPDPVDAVVRVRTPDGSARLPERGTVRLPPVTGMFLPVGYDLGAGFAIAQATVQLLRPRVSRRRAVLDVWSPEGGECLITVPGGPAKVTVDGAPVPFHVSRHDGATLVRLDVSPGERNISIET
ncbi:MAG TPA: hypothetical protein VF972_06865, partial [Actinomycetota bacterium]